MVAEEKFNEMHVCTHASFFENFDLLNSKLLASLPLPLSLWLLFWIFIKTVAIAKDFLIFWEDNLL